MIDFLLSLHSEMVQLEQNNSGTPSREMDDTAEVTKQSPGNLFVENKSCIVLFTIKCFVFCFASEPSRNHNASKKTPGKRF